MSKIAQIVETYQCAYLGGVRIIHKGHRSELVEATGPGNPPAVQVCTAKTDRFGSRAVQKPDLLNLGRPNPDPYPLTPRLSRVYLHLSLPISGSAFRVSHLLSHSDMLLIIVKY